jgi:membrane protein DedA with SNARE-associated domain
MAFINQLIEWLIQGIHVVITTMGYAGVALLMAIESANVPIPSEFIMPYAGFLVQQGKMNLHLAALAGAVGCVLGSLPCYWLGYYGGRNFLKKYGKWLLLSENDLLEAERWTNKYGDLAFFLCRMLPVVRTFISLPAGILKANLKPFLIYTFLGSLIWSYALVWVGFKLGQHLEAFKEIWHKFDVAIVSVVLLLGVWYVYRHLKGHRNEQPSEVE